VLNELNIKIYEHDEAAMEKWKVFMEENKWVIRANYLISH
jgi:hypothetical protein